LKALGRLALSGLVAVLPVAVTIYIPWWLGSRAEAVLGGLLRHALPEALYVPGAGLVLGFALLIGVGIFMRAVLAQRLAALLDRVLDRIPLVKTVYGIGGCTILVPRSTLTPVEMTVSEALRFAITGGRPVADARGPGSTPGPPTAARYLAW
jgi:uncharacterized membrane protein